MIKSRFLTILMVLLLVLLPQACKKKEAGPEKIIAEVLNLVPAGASLLFSIDTEAAFELPQLSEAYQDFLGKMEQAMQERGMEDFFSGTGLDLKKDLKRVTNAMYNIADGDSEILLIAEMGGDYERLVNYLQGRELMEATEEYRKTRIWTPKDGSVQEEKAEDMRVAFLPAGKIIFGNLEKVKQSIDLANGSGDSIKKTQAITDNLKTVKTDALFWIVISPLPLPEGEAEAIPFMPSGLADAQALHGYFDFSNKVYTLQLNLVSSNADANKEMLDMLNGFKAILAMGASQDEPNGKILKEVLDKIDLQAAQDRVTLTLAIPEALMAELAIQAQDKAGHILQGNDSEEIEEIEE